MTTLAELIETHCAGMTDYEAIAAVLNAQPTIDNPDAAEQVLRPLSLEDVFGVIASLDNAETEMPKLANLPDWAYQGAVAAMAERTSQSIDNWLVTVSKICGFAPSTVQAMAAAKATLMAEKIADPRWSATVAGPSIAAAAGLPVVTSAQVQAALNA